jgi:hypothetical protein
MKKKKKHTWKVYEDGNLHPYDEDERIFVGEYRSLKKAERVCRKRIESYLRDEKARHPGIRGADLYDYYLNFGPDPFIIGGGFRAWKYAEKRCMLLTTQWKSAKPERNYLEFEGEAFALFEGTTRVYRVKNGGSLRLIHDPNTASAIAEKGVIISEEEAFWIARENEREYIHWKKAAWVFDNVTVSLYKILPDESLERTSDLNISSVARSRGKSISREEAILIARNSAKDNKS